MKYISTLIAVVFLLILSTTVFAQESESETMTFEEFQTYQEEFLATLAVEDPLTEEELGQIVSCTDIIETNSVDIDMYSPSSELLSGMSASFDASLQNKNDKDVSNGTLYIKVLKINELSTDVVDMFVVKDRISIPAKDSVSVPFTWQVPSLLQSGEYKIAAFFYVDNQLDVTGVSYNKNIAGSLLDFSVDGEVDGGVAFDSSSLVLNKKPYLEGNLPEVIDISGEVMVSVPIVNTSTEGKNIQVQWKLYKDDAKKESNLISTSNSDVSILANDSLDIDYQVIDSKYSVYYLVGEIKDQDVSSFVEIRYSRGGVVSASIQYSSLGSYPLVSREENSINICVHGNGVKEVIRDGKVSVEIKDKKGKIIDVYEYVGPITNKLMSVGKKFTPSRTVDEFSVDTRVWVEGVLTDETTTVYNCETQNSGACDSDNVNSIWYSLAGLLTVIILLIIIIKMKTNKKIILPMFVLGLFLLGSFQPVEAASGSVGANYSGISLYHGSSQGNYAYRWSNPSIYVGYNIEVWNADTNAGISNNATVVEGTRLKFKILGDNSHSISWSGYSDFSSKNISGNGVWTSNASAPSFTTGGSCTGYYSDTITNGLSANAYSVPRDITHTQRVHIPLSVRSAGRSISTSGNMTCGSMTGSASSGYEVICTVNGGGALKAEFNFPDTYGKFYQQGYNTYTSNISGATRPGCNGDNSSFVEYSPLWSYQKQLNNNEFPIPGKKITVNITGTPAVPANNPPNPPVISGPTTGNTSATYTFGFDGTDPDGDKVRYGVSWNNNNTVNEWLPATAYVNSGVQKNQTKSWGQTGTKTFKALTEDQAGLRSGWRSYTITISDPVPVVNGSCSTTNANSCITGTMAYAPNDTTAAYLWTCSGSGGGSDASCSRPKTIDGSCGSTNNSCLAGTSVDAADTSTAYKWSCTGISGGTTDVCSVAKPVNGSCGTTNNSCTNGTSVDTTDTATTHNWNCNGTNGGSNISCVIPRTASGPFDVSCSAASVRPGQQATFTAIPQNEIGSVSYQWKDGSTNISGATSATHRETFSTIGQYRRDVSATNQGSTVSDYCFVTVGCDASHNEGDEATLCTTGTQDVWTCTSSGWTKTNTPCTPEPPDGEFSFDPGIVGDASGTCKLILDAENVTSCRLVKNGSTVNTSPSLNSYLVGSSISINKTVSVSIGRYVIECTGLDSVTTKTLGTKSCILNPDLREN